jgi:ribosome maturation factor RimP
LNKTEKRVYEKAKQLTDEMGYVLWDVEFVKEGAEKYLRVLIDSENGITIDDCEKLTKPLNDWLDVEDFIAESYIFEVGSAGLVRELKNDEHLEWARGEDVEVKFIRPQELPNKEKVKTYVGKLNDFGNEYIKIDDVEFGTENISKIKTYLEF